MIRLLYLPNEADETDPAQHQVGPRKALKRLLDEGAISGLEIFSFLSKYYMGTPVSEINRELLDIADRLQPNVIFWEHVSEFPVKQSLLDELRSRSGCRLLVYHDPDPFDGRVKRVSAAMRTLLTNSDLTLLVGLEPMLGLMRRNGARNVRYLPQNYDNVRFGTPWMPTNDRPYALTMIANCIRRRIPGLYIPGGRRRMECARKLSARFGRSFALFGSGWEGLEAARGPLPFKEQEKLIRSGWVSVNWDHFDNISYYSSNRLPISLAAGVVHVTTYHTGFEHLFRGCPGLYWGRTVEEVVACVEWLLSRPKAELIEEGLAAHEWVSRHREADIVYRHAIEMCREALSMVPGRPCD